ncbi:hypothetical protein LINGRAHAP2_LOCUS22155 [Linum grandiflorum]
MDTLNYSTKNVLLVVFFMLCFIISPPCVQGRRLRVLMSDEKHEAVVVVEEYSKNSVKDVPSNEIHQLSDSGEKKLDPEVQHKETKNLVKEVPSADETKSLESGQKNLDGVAVQHEQSELSESDDLVRLDYSPMSNKPPVHN